MNKLFLLASLVPLLLTMTLSSAYATWIDGHVEDFPNDLNDALATGERAGEYTFDRSNASGDYSMPVEGANLYTVQTSKAGYDRDSDDVIGGNTAPDQFLNTRDNITVLFSIAADSNTSVSPTDARNELFRAEEFFEEEHGIVFSEENTDTWDSDDETSNDSCVIKGELENDTDWDSGTYHGADILFGVSDGKISGDDSKACANVPGSGGTHPSIYVDMVGAASESVRDKRVAHEMAHVYGFDHSSSCTNVIPGLMAVTASTQCADYIINLRPSYDNTLENRRTWY